MSKLPKRSLPAKLYFKIMGEPDRPLYLKIYSKVPSIALLVAFTLGTMAADESTKIVRSGSPDGVRIARIESSSRAVSTAFLALGVGVFGSYLLAVADRLAIAQSDRPTHLSRNQNNSEDTQ